VSFVVTEIAEADQIRWIIRSTFRQRNDVMDLVTAFTTSLPVDQSFASATRSFFYQLSDFPPAIFLSEPVDC
jgi:hypothetical protein